jgi:peptide/nickel transport system permease protein
MLKFLANRILNGLIVLIIVVVLTFVFTRLLPGDAFLAQIQAMQTDVDAKETVARLKAYYGLDKPIPIQFVNWLTNFVQGDWGESMNRGEDVRKMFTSRFRVTLELFVHVNFWIFIIGIPAGIISALKRNTRVDTAVTTAALISLSIPAFWLAIVMIYVLAVMFPIFPPFGYVSFDKDPIGNIMSLAMPGFVIGSAIAGIMTRYVRSGMLEVLRQDYVRTARAKGLPESTVIIVHALKPSLIPIVTLTGLIWIGLIGGIVIIEEIFAIPGLGRMFFYGIIGRDFPVIQAFLVVNSIIILSLNVVVDIVYGLLDPRIRIQ